MDDEEENIFNAIDGNGGGGGESQSDGGFSPGEGEFSGGVMEAEVDDGGMPEDGFSDSLAEIEDYSAHDSEEPPASEDESGGYTTMEDEAEEEEIQPFDEKLAAENAMDNNGKKPPMLNRQFILYCIIGVFVFTIIFATLIFPLITRHREKLKNGKPVATENEMADYSLLIHEDPESDEEYEYEILPDGTRVRKRKKPKDGEVDARTDEEILRDLPPIEYNGKPIENTPPPPQEQYYGGSGGGYVPPDTREDKLQQMEIKGIKGLTSTQKHYMTPDGNENDAAFAAQNPYGGGYSGSRANSPSGSMLSSSSNGANPYEKFGMPSQSEYMNQMLSRYEASQRGANSYAQQNDQSGKNSFFNNGRGNTFGQWLAPNTVWIGTIFEAALTSAVNTDLPGECTAVVTKNVYSSLDGRYLLIPQNSKLFGTYNSSVSYSQKRIQIGWHTLIRPDGYMINLGNMNATDTKGASGVRARINEHFGQYLKAILLMSVFNIMSSEFQNTANTSNNQYVQNVAANSQQVSNTLGSKLIDRALDVQPTLKIKQGTIINIVANGNIEIPPLDPYEVTQPYHRDDWFYAEKEFDRRRKYYGR